MRSIIISFLLSICCLVHAGEAFSAYILDSVRTMPAGGGYAADRAAELRLARRGITWDGRQLRISPQGAAPTFCSAACYMVLLRALQRWSAASPAHALGAAVWAGLRVEAVHPDGYLSWGRANANGPGFAKWVHDLGVGVNFGNIAAAQPGDFLKFFHTSAIGAEERGHLVVFLGVEQQGGVPCVRYWSSNRAGGYGVQTLPLHRMQHLIFTRITHPERFARVPSLSPSDSWLASLLLCDTSFAEVCRRCGVKK